MKYYRHYEHTLLHSHRPVVLRGAFIDCVGYGHTYYVRIKGAYLEWRYCIATSTLFIVLHG
jgi:hypothetical protein